MIAHVQTRGSAFTLDLERDPRWLDHLEHQLNRNLRSSRDPVVLRWPADEPEPERVVDEIEAAYERLRMGERTVANNGARSVRNFIATLLRCTPWYPRAAWAPFAGCPAFVVGAGPSLDRNIALLARAQQHGPIIANQTSARALLANGIEPDLVVCVETVDCAYWLGSIPRHIPMLVGATAHPGNFVHSEHVTTFVNHEPALAGYAAALGSVPLPFSTCVTAASVSFALHQGAAHVVLVGMDLAFTEGRCYAAGTRVEDLRARDDDGMLVFAGESEARRPQLACYRDGYGGGAQVLTSFDMHQQALWFERAAEHHEIINATEGGSRIAGTCEMTLADALQLSGPSKRARSAERAATTGTSPVLWQLLGAARRVVADESCWLPPPDLPLLNLWVKGATHAVAALPIGERRARCRDATKQGAQAVLELLERWAQDAPEEGR